MGTRTWSRKGVLTAAGRRRQASLGAGGTVNADTLDIWGNKIDDLFGNIEDAEQSAMEFEAPEAIRRLDGIRKRALERITRILTADDYARPSKALLAKLKRFAASLRGIDAKISEEEGTDPALRRWRMNTPGLPSFYQSERYTQQIVDEEVAKGSTVPKGTNGRPLAVLMMGIPGSGKSTMRAKEFSDEGFVRADPDEIKEKFPHYWIKVGNSDSKAANDVHGASTAIGRKIWMKACDEKKNVLIDGTGRDQANMEGIIKRLKKNGYDVRIMMPHVSVDVAEDRAIARANQNGRRITRRLLEDVYPEVVRNFPRLAAQVDSAILQDSVTGKNIMTYRNGKGTVVDRSKAREFVPSVRSVVGSGGRRRYDRGS